MSTSWSRQDEDEAAVERYRYLLRTADPSTIEQVHQEAFARLTPEQRRTVFQQLVDTAPDGEAPDSDDAAVLARSATRSELRQPGFLERTFGGSTFGAAFGGSMLGGIAGVVVGSVLMNGLGHLFSGPGLLGGGGPFGGGGLFGGGRPMGGPGFGGGPGGGPGGFGGGSGGGFGGGPGVGEGGGF